LTFHTDAAGAPCVAKAVRADREPGHRARRITDRRGYRPHRRAACVWNQSDGLAGPLARADAALYRAKNAGRHRAGAWRPGGTTLPRGERGSR